MAPALAGVRLGFKVPLRRAETSWEAAPHRLSAGGQPTISSSCKGRYADGPAVRPALTTERFRVRDLPGNLDDAGKLVLVRRLIREGLLQPLDQTQL